MKAFLSILVILTALCYDIVQGQNIMWQQRYSWPGSDALTDIVSLNDGTYLAVGGGGFSGIGLLRFNDDGDTIYLRQLPMSRGYYTSIRLCRMKDGKVYVVNANPRKMVLGKIDPEFGVLEWSLNLPGVGPPDYAPNTNDFTEGPGSTLLIAGDCVDPLGQATSIGYIGCFDTLGLLKWTREIREHPTFTLCNHIDQTPEGRILVSGTAGSRIWAGEFSGDSGREIRRATFYQSPSLILFDYANSWVLQAPNDQYIVSGITRNNRSYIGMHEGWAGPKVWGFERPGVIRAAQVNSDGGIITFRTSSPNFILSRIRVDSTTYWTMRLALVPGQINTIPLAYAPVADSSSIIVGYSYFQDSTAQDWYVARITNMGIPYDPSTVVSAKPGITVKPYAYPTPCRESLGFSGLRSPSELELVDIQGRVVLTTEIWPERMVDVSALVPGLYQYRLSSAGRVYSGRVMKE